MTSERYSCEACGQFMDLDEDDLLPLHVDYDDASRMCPGSGTENYRTAADCYCCALNMPPCSPCEDNRVDFGDAAPAPAGCSHAKAAGLCGLECPLFMRAECPTPEAVLELTPQARVLDAGLLGIFEDLVVVDSADLVDPAEQMIERRRAALEMLHERKLK